MALRGNPNSQSLTLVSGSTPTAVAGQDLGVVLTVPESPFTGRIATLQFDWQSPAIGGNAAGVIGFSIGSLIYSSGGVLFRGGQLFNFRRISESSYSVQVQIESGTSEFTIIVPRNAAQLASDPNVEGPAELTDASFTIEEIPRPHVEIGVPVQRPITVRPVPLTFDWTYADGERAPVENFVVDDIETDVGDIEGFAPVPGDASRYTANLVIPDGTTDATVTISIAADVAQVANSDPAILGPPEATETTFDIAAVPAIATVTGADAVCVLTRDIVSNEYLNDVVAHLGSNAGGGFTGVFEPVAIGDYLYYVVQVRKFTQTVDDDGDLVTPTNPENFLADLQAGAALVRVNTATCQFELLKAYSDVTLAARSLTVDGTTLYFFEGSHYMYEDDLTFSDQQWREKVGRLYKIEHPSSIIEEIGLNWRSATTTDNPDTETTDYFYGIHGGTVSPIVVVDHPETTEPVIHLLTGFGNFDDIAQPRRGLPVNRAGNWNWIQYHSRLNQRLSEVLTNGRTGFDVLKDIAIVTNSILGFDNDTFFLIPREPQKAINGGGSGISATQTVLTADDLNWGEFPSEGWLYVDGELIKHSGADANGQFSGIERGVEGTTAVPHTGDFEIQFVDHILSLNADTLEMPIKSIVAQNDNRQFYNRVKLRYGGGDEEVLVENTTSITENGARLLEVDVPLDAHQREWAEWLAESYLAQFKDIHQILNLTLKPSLYMALRDVIYLKVPERMHLNGTLCRMLRIPHNFRQPPTTEVKLVTL